LEKEEDVQQLKELHDFCYKPSELSFLASGIFLINNCTARKKRENELAVSNGRQLKEEKL